MIRGHMNDGMTQRGDLGGVLAVLPNQYDGVVRQGIQSVFLYLSEGWLCHRYKFDSDAVSSLLTISCHTSGIFGLNAPQAELIKTSSACLSVQPFFFKVA